MLFTGHFDRILAVVGEETGVPRVLEREAQRLHDERFVIDDENFFPGRSLAHGIIPTA